MSDCIHPEGCELERRGSNANYKILYLRHDKVTFGRSPDMSYCLNSTFVSRHHATFLRKDGFWNLTDEKSFNGLFLNGGRLPTGTTVNVRRGDLIGFGVPATKTSSDERAFVYELKCNCANRDPTRVKLEYIDSSTTILNSEPIMANSGKIAIKPKLMNSTNLSSLSSSIVQHLKTSKFNFNVPSTSRSELVDTAGSSILLSSSSSNSHLSSRGETVNPSTIQRKGDFSEIRVKSENVQDRLATECILCGKCHQDGQCAQLTTALQKIKVEQTTPGWNLNFFKPKVKQRFTVRPEKENSMATFNRRSPGTETADLKTILQCNTFAPVSLLINYVTRQYETQNTIEERIVSNVSSFTSFILSNVSTVSEDRTNNLRSLENKRETRGDQVQTSSHEIVDKLSSYSQDYEIICISDDEEYYQPSQSKPKKVGLTPVKQEPVDRWYNFDGDQDDAMDANEGDDNIRIGDDLAREDPDNAPELDLEFALHSEGSDDELLVSPFKISAREKSASNRPSTSKVSGVKNDDDEDRFFPVLSQSFFDGDESNDFDADKDSSKKVETSKKPVETSTKPRFYGTLLTEPLPMRRGSHSSEKPRRFSSSIDIPKRRSAIERRPQRTTQKNKRDLKKMVKDQLGNRIPIPGGGSGVIRKLRSPVKPKQIPQATATSSRDKPPGNDFTVQAKLKRSVNTTKEKTFRFASRSEFLTADLAKSKTAAVPVVGDTGVKVVASTSELMDIDCDIDIPMEIENNETEVQTEQTKRKVRFSEIRETRTIPNLMAKNVKTLGQKDVPENGGPVVKPSIDWQIEDIIGVIVSWNPSWLKKQREEPKPPPITGDTRLRGVYNCYKSFDEYFEMFKPLLLLETWANITKSFDQGQLLEHFVAVLQIIPRNIRPGQFVQTVDIICQNLCGHEDFVRRQHILEGNLVILHVRLKSEAPQNSAQAQLIFAYVVGVERRPYKSCASIISPVYDGHVLNKPQSDAQVFTCTLRAKMYTMNADLSQLMKIEILSYMKPSIRLFQALLNLPKTVMVRDILQPRKRTFETQKNQLMPFKAKGEYNRVQREAIIAIADVCCQGSCPKICLLQGPPGTGKSHTIIGLIQQILHAPDMKSKCGMKPKILLAAASNAAVDELVRRLITLKHSLRGEKLNFVRVGNIEQVHADVKKYTLENLVRMNMTEKLRERSNENRETELNLLQARVNSTQTKLDSAISKNDSEEIMALSQKLNDLNGQMTLLQNAQGAPSGSEFRRLEDRQFKTILEGADVIATTLSSCRQSFMETTFAKKIAFTACIVDEATQCIEASTLMPLLYGISKLILVGDPEQLAATVLSRQAQELGLSQSLFERFYRQFKVDMTDNLVLMLTTQYRMHPEICRFPSKHFYEGKLITDSTYEIKFRAMKFIPYLLFNLVEVQEESNNGQLSNSLEIEFIIKLVGVILKCGASRYSIGIITPYQAQKHKLTEELKKRNPDAAKTIEVNTVDGFQGREKDIIIFSTVRAKSDTGTIGFLTQEKRLNVALTRARHCLYICGHLQSLNVNTHWRALNYDANERGHVVNVGQHVNPSILEQLILKPS